MMLSGCALFEFFQHSRGYGRLDLDDRWPEIELREQIFFSGLDQGDDLLPAQAFPEDGGDGQHGQGLRLGGGLAPQVVGPWRSN